MKKRLQIVKNMKIGIDRQMHNINITQKKEKEHTNSADENNKNILPENNGDQVKFIEKKYTKQVCPVKSSPKVISNGNNFTNNIEIEDKDDIVVEEISLNSSYKNNNILNIEDPNHNLLLQISNINLNNTNDIIRKGGSSRKDKLKMEKHNLSPLKPCINSIKLNTQVLVFAGLKQLTRMKLIYLHAKRNLQKKKKIFLIYLNRLMDMLMGTKSDKDKLSATNNELL